MSSKLAEDTKTDADELKWIINHGTSNEITLAKILLKMIDKDDKNEKQTFEN